MKHRDWEYLAHQDQLDYQDPQAHQVTEETMDPQETQDHKDQEETQVQMV